MVRRGLQWRVRLLDWRPGYHRQRRRLDTPQAGDKLLEIDANALVVHFELAENHGHLLHGRYSADALAAGYLSGGGDAVKTCSMSWAETRTHTTSSG